MKKAILIIGILSLIVVSNTNAETVFTDISSAIGGSGVAAMGDVNGDGWVDLLGCGGILLNKGEIVDGKPTFKCVREGLDFTNEALSHSVFTDIDGDGDQDLIAAERFGDGRLYRNDSCGDELRFVDITAEVGMGSHISNEQTHIALADIDGDGDLDVYLTEGWQYGNGGVLYLNESDSQGIHFVDVTDKSGLVAPVSCRTILFNDYDGDGDPDLYLGSHGSANKFYLNQGDINNDGIPDFKDVTAKAGLNYYGYDNGATAGDIDNDGDIDIVQAVARGANLDVVKIFRNEGDTDNDGIVNFKDVTAYNGIAKAAHHGVGLGDVDNDGDLDLADANFHSSPLKFYSNDGDGTFTNITAESGIGYLTYGVRTLFADIDNDGDLDLWMNRLFMNNSNNGNFLKVVLLGEGLNRDAVGAQLRVWPSGAARTNDNLVAFREVTAGTAFFSSDDYVLELGLTAGLYDLEATFVGGAVAILEGVQTGQTVYMLEGPDVEIHLTGNAGMCEPENTSPVADAGPDQAIECSGPDGTPVTLDGSGSSDPEGDELTYTWTWDGGSAEGMNPMVTLPYGTTTVTLTVSDGEYEDTNEVDISIADTTPPSTSAVLEGGLGSNGWYISDLTITLASIDSCTGVKEVHDTINGDESVTSGDTASFTLGEDGTYTVNYWGVDNAGNVEQAKGFEVQMDRTAPVVDLSVTPGLLWPPNHKMVDVAVNGGANDPASGVVSVEFTVTDEYGTVEPVINGFNTAIPLEAWRNGGDKDGRHYTITAVITDEAGNVTTVTTEAVCPHDMREKK